MLAAALLLAAAVADWVPMRWISADPASLRLLDGSPINCLLLEEAQWGVREAVRSRGLAAVAVVHDDGQAERAAKLGFDGFAVEGTVTKRLPRAIRLGTRREIRMEAEVAATRQGVWPGIEVEHGGPKTSSPTGTFWIHTNTGVLRYLRAATAAPVWIANTPPPGDWPVTRYLQAIADAGAVGARWVIAVDEGFAARMRSGEGLKEWARLVEYVRFYERNAAWRKWPVRSEVVMLHDADSGALTSGNLLDMLSVMNTPVRSVPSRELSAQVLDGAKVAVSLNPGAYTAEQRALIAKFGGKVVAGPEGWRMPQVIGERFTFGKKDYDRIEAIWPELHTAVQRKNFGARLFNVTGTLSYLQVSEGKALLNFVNYTDFPVESITAFVQGKYRKATLHEPGAGPRALVVYDAPEGTGVEIDRLDIAGAVILE